MCLETKFPLRNDRDIERATWRSREQLEIPVTVFRFSGFFAVLNRLLAISKPYFLWSFLTILSGLILTMVNCEGTLLPIGVKELWGRRLGDVSSLSKYPINHRSTWCDDINQYGVRRYRTLVTWPARTVEPGSRGWFWQLLKEANKAGVLFWESCWIPVSQSSNKRVSVT